ncbi:MAG: hypothetical protein ACI9RO_000948, partial [Alteromonas macleodii]
PLNGPYLPSGLSFSLAEVLDAVSSDFGEFISQSYRGWIQALPK